MASEWREAIWSAVAADSWDVALAENQSTGRVSQENAGGSVNIVPTKAIIVRSILFNSTAGLTNVFVVEDGEARSIASSQTWEDARRKEGSDQNYRNASDINSKISKGEVI